MLSQARSFIDPHKMPESTLTVVAQWDCRVNINQQEWWLIVPLLPYSPPSHHVHPPCSTFLVHAASVDFFFFFPSRHSAVCGNVSNLDQDPINTLCSSHLTLECITDHIRTSPAKPEKHIFHLTLAFKNKLQTAWIKLYALSRKEENLQKKRIIIIK